jgi:hypothetical protein
MVYVAVPFIAVSVMLAFQTYATASLHRFVIHPFFALRARTYVWTDVQRIILVKSYRAPNGHIRRDLPHYIIVMTDGWELNFHRTLLELPWTEQIRFAAFVEERSHRPVETEDPYPYSHP